MRFFKQRKRDLVLRDRLVLYMDHLDYEVAQMRREGRRVLARTAEFSDAQRGATTRGPAAATLVLCLICAALAIGVAVSGLSWWAAFGLYALGPAVIIILRMLIGTLFDAGAALSYGLSSDKAPQVLRQRK